ncbi:cytoglobin-1-like isoform X2 [Lepisosteus oculatus]|uniref:cytoglobin-1-like isoform X2 n=1 Tax=Lepisosteus oculatus TaxID=7918 RepID=UPI00073FC912|nr:PREDICTED: cytoglobin-1-like [Lepisosteus oculatus]
MGCALSGSGVSSGASAPDSAGSKRDRAAESTFASAGGSEIGGARGPGFRLKSEPVPLTESQKDLIRESWKVVHQDIARLGIIMFIRLFETHPECKDVFFIFREIDDLQELKMSKELQAHGLRVMSFIEKSVARLAQEDKLEQIALELGKCHCRYNAPPKYYEYVGVQFISAVKPILKDSWSPQVEQAWESLFAYLAAVMKRGYHEEEHKDGVNKASYARKRPPQSPAEEAPPNCI